MQTVIPGLHMILEIWYRVLYDRGIQRKGILMDMMEIMRNKQQARINKIATFVAMWELYTKTKDENLLEILDKAVDEFIAKENK